MTRGGMQHRPCALHQQPPQIGVSSLGDMSQAALASRGVLSWREAEPSSKLSAVLEVSSIADGGDDGLCGQRPDAAYSHQAPGGLTLFGQHLDLAIVDGDSLIEQRQVCAQILDHASRQHRQRLSATQRLSAYHFRALG